MLEEYSYERSMNVSISSLHFSLENYENTIAFSSWRLPVLVITEVMMKDCRSHSNNLVISQYYFRYFRYAMVSFFLHFERWSRDDSAILHTPATCSYIGTFLTSVRDYLQGILPPKYQHHFLGFSIISTVMASLLEQLKLGRESPLKSPSISIDYLSGLSDLYIRPYNFYCLRSIVQI